MLQFPAPSLRPRYELTSTWMAEIHKQSGPVSFNLIEC